MIWLALLLAQGAGNPALIERGEAVFAQNCSVGYCHGVAGAAGRGPRLRGRAFEKNYLERVIRDGIPSSAMPAWKGRLKEEDIRAVVEYAAGLGAASAEAAAPANPAPPETMPAALPAFQGPPQAERGYHLFFDATRETRCGTCHSLGGRGIAIGPDLTALAAKPPREIAAAIRSERSRNVLNVRLKDGEFFPALRLAQSGNWIKLYDLTVAPPVLRTAGRAEIESITQNANWRHSVFVKDYTQAQLADIISYLRWTALGERQEIRTDDLN